MSSLLDTEPEAAFELNGPGVGGSSIAASSSIVGTQAYHSSNSVLPAPHERSASPAPPQYDLGVRKPLGAAESDIMGGKSKMEDESGSSTSKEWNSNASSMVMRSPLSVVPSPSPPSSTVSGSTPFVQRTKIGGDLASMQKKALAQFNEICVKRGEKPDWDFTATGPAHSRQWEARLLCASRRCPFSTM